MAFHLVVVVKVVVVLLLNLMTLRKMYKLLLWPLKGFETIAKPFNCKHLQIIWVFRDLIYALIDQLCGDKYKFEQN